jgi:hypothetical protein
MLFLFKHKFFPISLTILLGITILNCSFSPTQPPKNPDPSAPVPGTPVTATAAGTTVSITWGQASDDGGAEWLVYKVRESYMPSPPAPLPVFSCKRMFLLNNNLYKYIELINQGRGEKRVA